MTQEKENLRIIATSIIFVSLKQKYSEKLCGKQDFQIPNPFKFSKIKLNYFFAMWNAM